MPSTRLVPTALALAALLAWPTAANADGLPVPVDTSNSGVSIPGGGPRYFSVPADRGAVVMRMSADGTRVDSRRFLAARSRTTPAPVIPAVAVDGTVSGLSANGRTLVLIEPRQRFPRSVTRFVVLAAKGLQVKHRITLEGDFSFDAISPDGSRIYLIHYLDRRDPTRYEVRAYDVAEGALRNEPIVDTSVVEIAMRGLPVTRATSPDGIWEYTLYDGNGKSPFVHALNVEDGQTHCIEVTEYLQGGDDLGNLALTPDGGTLVLESQVLGPAATIDTTSFELGDLRNVPIDQLDPAIAEALSIEQPVLESSGDGDSGSGPPALVIVIGAAVAVGGIGFVIWRRHRRPTTDAIADLDFEPAESPGPDAQEGQGEAVTMPGTPPGAR